MLGSHSIPILFALLPALITATPWYRRETPGSVISDNAVVQETSPLPAAGAGVTNDGYVSSVPAVSTLVSSLASTLVSGIPSGVATTDMYGSTILPSGPAATDAYGAPVVDGNAAASPPAYGTSNVSSVATPAVASPALCGTPLGTTYLSQAMIIPNERTRLEWGPAGQVHVGQAGPFMFPFYCGYTNFTVYAWEVGANIEDKAQATAKYCTVTGGNIGLTAPVIILNVMNAAPYFGIVDMGVDKNLTFTGDCMSTVTTLPGTCDVSAAPPADAPAYGQNGEVASNTTANGTDSTGAETGTGVTSAVPSSVISDVTSGVTSANATGTPTDMAAGQTGNVTSQGSSVESTGGSSGGSSVESTGGSSDSNLAQSTGTGVTSGGTSLNATGDATAMGAGQTGNVTTDGLASPTSNGTSGGSSGEPTGEPTDVAAAQSANVTIVTSGGMTYTSNITSVAEPTSVVDNTSGGSSDSSSDESTGGSSGESTGGSTGGTTAQSTDGSSVESTASPTTDGSSAGSTPSPTTDPAPEAEITDPTVHCDHFRVLPGDIRDGRSCYDNMSEQRMKEVDEEVDKEIAEKHPSS